MVFGAHIGVGAKGSLHEIVARVVCGANETTPVLAGVSQRKAGVRSSEQVVDAVTV